MTTQCQGESCCTNIVVPGGTFMMGRSTDGTDASSGGSDETPERPVEVASFALDKYEVTVGRFRQFVDSYDGTPPASGAGAHPEIDGTGWNSSWDGELPSGQSELKVAITCNSTYETWTEAPGANEDKAMNCVNWYEAFAFCIWDGGRLPTEAEWEFAAAGGDENRLYPWGSEEPDSEEPANDCLLANWAGCEPDEVRPVGASAAGNGRWGHADLAGNVFEWTFDWYASNFYSTGPSENPANVTAASDERVFRGGGFVNGVDNCRAADRSNDEPVHREVVKGFRCARSTP